MFERVFVGGGEGGVAGYQWFGPEGAVPYGDPASGSPGWSSGVQDNPFQQQEAEFQTALARAPLLVPEGAIVAPTRAAPWYVIDGRYVVPYRAMTMALDTGGMSDSPYAWIDPGGMSGTVALKNGRGVLYRLDGLLGAQFESALVYSSAPRVRKWVTPREEGLFESMSGGLAIIAPFFAAALPGIIAAGGAAAAMPTVSVAAPAPAAVSVPSLGYSGWSQAELAAIIESGTAGAEGGMLEALAGVAPPSGVSVFDGLKLIPTPSAPGVDAKPGILDQLFKRAATVATGAAASVAAGKINAMLADEPAAPAPVARPATNASGVLLLAGLGFIAYKVGLA